MTEQLVIDVSKWQGVINWQLVKDSGVYGVMLRAGYGSGNVDPQFARNAKECNRLGIPIGVYWFSYASTPDMAETEAAYCLGAITPYKIDLPVAFDWEYDSYTRAVKNGVTPTPALTVAMAKRFLAKIENAGYVPMLYTNIDYRVRFFRTIDFPGIDIWLAAYRSTKPDGTFAMWQYSDKGTIPGITGNVDMNRLYVDYLTKPEPDKEDYAALVCDRVKLSDATKAYINGYKYAGDLWRKLWDALNNIS